MMLLNLNTALRVVCSGKYSTSAVFAMRPHPSTVFNHTARVYSAFTDLLVFAWEDYEDDY